MPSNFTNITAGEDSLATVAENATDMVMPWESHVCTADEAPVVLQGHFITGRVPYTRGMLPEPRAILPGYDSGVVCLLLAAFVILAANFRNYSLYLKKLPSNLWSVKTRGNVFDDAHTLSETRMVIAMTVVLCVLEGVLLFSVLRPFMVSWARVGVAVSILSGAAMLFYLVQLAVYSILGYIFATPRASALWLKGFNASQSVLAMLLVVPALWVLFNPGTATLMAIIGASAYVLGRILFICKGFRIFYDYSYSLVYFILYLCALEIAPIVLICRSVLNFTDCL